jgi:hypothetical protein
VIQTSAICDFCGKVKGETNHWWCVSLIRNGEDLRIIKHWYGHDHGVKDACSESCVTKAVSRFMATRKLEA